MTILSACAKRSPEQARSAAPKGQDDNPERLREAQP
jgi:hypothetical protein